MPFNLNLDKHVTENCKHKISVAEKKEYIPTYQKINSYNFKDPVECLNNKDNIQERHTWGNGIEFVLSLIGYAVSLGNIWRFPYLCYRNGGGAFLIPYWLMLFICGIPLFFLEVVLGQFSGKGAIHVWDICPLFRGVGVGTLLLTAIGSSSYNLLLALILYFLFSSFKHPLPWSNCNNDWNSPSCIVLRAFNRSNQGSQNNLSVNSFAHSISQISNYSNTQIFNSSSFSLSDVYTSSSHEFLSNRVLQITDGLHHMGNMNRGLVGYFILAWVIVYLCLIKGIKSVGKIVYFTAIFPYLILAILLVRCVLLPGALQGILFFLKPDWKKLKNLKIWNEAATQIFYSLGPGWSGIITMASYNKFRNNCVRDSVIVSLVNCGTSIYAGLVVFSVVGFMSHVLAVPVDKVATQGVGLAFIVYPEALLHLPLPNLWSILFFTMLITVGIDTIFVQLEVVYSAIYDALPPNLKGKRSWFTLLASIIMMLLGLPYLLQGGIYLFQLFDWYMAILSVMIFCIIETITVGWIYGAKRFIKDIEFMLDRPLPCAMLLIVLWKYVIPVLLLIALIFNIVFHVPVQYGNYVYPGWAASVGWGISVSSVIPVPLYAAYKLYTTKGTTFKKRLLKCLKPSRKWGPSGEPFRAQYLLNDEIQALT